MTSKRAVATLAMLGGAYEIAGAGIEGWAGRGQYDGAGPVLAVVLGAIAGALLLAAGVALLRRSPGPSRVARRAAIACLALVVIVQLVFPFMSIFSRLLGIGVPLAILLVSRIPRGTHGRAAVA